MKWSVVYKRAVNPDGSLLFPERLSYEFLHNARKTMGTWLFANQYMNDILPEGEQPFKKEWIKYYETIPENCFTYAFIDPAISQQDTADYTALVVVKVDHMQNWYVQTATRYRITPTELVELVFRVVEHFSPQCIGIEEVAFQKALLYMVTEEMKRRGKIIPVKGVKASTDKSKELRIMGIVPRFEFGRVFLNKGLHDFEMEYAQFPRGAHDDLLDSLAYIDQIASYPQEPKPDNKKPHHPGDGSYEKWFINQLSQNKPRRTTNDDEY